MSYWGASQNQTFAEYAAAKHRLAMGRLRINDPARAARLRNEIATLALDLAGRYFTRWIAKTRLAGEIRRAVIRDRDDFVATAAALLTDRAHKYDPARAKAFSFATRVVQNSFISSVRSLARPAFVLRLSDRMDEYVPAGGRRAAIGA